MGDDQKTSNNKSERMNKGKIFGNSSNSANHDKN